MSESSGVDATKLPERLHSLLRPDEVVHAADGCEHRLPRFFFEIESWAAAKETFLTPNFTLAELITVDSREAAPLLTEWPHYVPCAIAVLARYLQVLRDRVGAPIYISANGGYRSAAHGRSKMADPHCWGAAADIYRVGDTWLDNLESIEKLGQTALGIGAEVHVKPPGAGLGESDDHLHLDIGYVTCVPRGCDESGAR